MSINLKEPQTHISDSFALNDLGGIAAHMPVIDQNTVKFG